ncbi:MAG TPA: hypothetical protein VK348_03355, partial [Planctomycetota bacterium]|nr:hypothetical protein [Planctomycetota bacterium]
MKAPRPRHPDSEPGYLGELQFTPKPPAESAASPLPLWFLLLPLLAVLPWWPIDPFWQSDDFLAIHYAQNLQRALHDLIGWQYGATDLLLFFRPLITLSFWVDVQLAGSAPFWSHLSNVLAHGGSTLLVGLLWTRLLTPGRAFTAALLWAIAPGHVGAISWAVGRVDAHTALWCLACLWLLLRWCEGRQRTRLPSLLALAAALLSKELAFAVPPIALVLAAAASLEPGLAARARAGLRASWPHWLLFAIYLGYRWLVLGGFGGYLSARYDLVPSLLGFATIVRNLLAPLWWCGEAVLVELCGSAPVWVRWLALLPAVVALAYWLRPQRVRAFVTVLAVFLLACAPMVAFCADPGNHHNLRYFYLPSAALAGLLVAPSRLLSLLLLLGAAIPLVEVRQLQLRADRETAAMHLELLHAVMNGAQSPLFVAGLPHSNPSGTAIQMHLFVDRMLEPPFGPGGVRLLPLRPAGRVADAFLLTEGGELPFALP